MPIYSPFASPARRSGKRIWRCGPSSTSVRASTTSPGTGRCGAAAARARPRSATRHEPARAGFVPDFLTPPPSHSAPTLAEQLGQIRATPASQVKEELERCLASNDGGSYRATLESLVADPLAARELLAERMEAAWDALVAPFWPRIEELIEADIGYRSHRLVTFGLRRTLDGLHPGIRWADGAVEVDGPGDAEVDLAGRGLVLMPSAYAWPVVTAIVDGPWQPTVIYPARGVAAALGGTEPTASTRSRGCSDRRAPFCSSASTARPRRPRSRRASDAVRAGSRGISSRCVTPGSSAASRRGHELRYGRTRLGAALLQGFEGRLTPFSSPETLARAAPRARARGARSRARRRPRRAARTSRPRARRCGR